MRKRKNVRLGSYPFCLVNPHTHDSGNASSYPVSSRIREASNRTIREVAWFSIGSFRDCGLLGLRADKGGSQALPLPTGCTCLEKDVSLDGLEQASFEPQPLLMSSQQDLSLTSLVNIVTHHNKHVSVSYFFILFDWGGGVKGAVCNKKIQKRKGGAEEVT